MDSGWIKLHRKLTEWEWYTDVPTKTLFIHLLLTANSKPGKWRGIDVPAGAKITSREKLSKETGLSQQQIRTALNKLESTNEVTKSTTATYTLIKLTNYEKYQLSNQVSNQQATNEQPSINQPATTNNKKRMKERKNDDDDDSSSEVASSLFGKFRNVPLTQVEYNTLMERHPKTGMDAIETVSEMLKENPNKPISSFPAYLNKIASGEKPAYRKQPAARQKTGVYSGQLPDWYSDTGSQFSSEQERQEMLEEVEKAKAEFEENMKGKK
ncbi:hypothetical protein [Faecalibaculum rodentium]|uniref:hypothetical protein n=1 Tax=Faecalibaculum rodentium TaxID=1702221 RepID=UPI0026EF5172|nr:hypothetical protein [Faecalibaculum rodentium]